MDKELLKHEETSYNNSNNSYEKDYNSQERTNPMNNIAQNQELMYNDEENLQLELITPI